MTISRRKELATTLETHTSQARSGNFLKTLLEPLFLASYVMPHHDDGPQVFLSGIVCLFGSVLQRNLMRSISNTLEQFYKEVIRSNVEGILGAWELVLYQRRNSYDIEIGMFLAVVKMKSWKLENATKALWNSVPDSK